MALTNKTDVNYYNNVDPTPANNFAAGFKPGAEWTNTTTNETWSCEGDGVWINSSKALKWHPPAFSLGSVVTSGTSAFNAIGAGHLITFDPNQDDEILLNIELDHNGMLYDGSNILISLIWQLFSAPSVGQNVKWELDYAFLEDGEDNYTIVDGTVVMDIVVGSRIQRQQYTDTFAAISGPSGSTHLQITLRRNGAGVGSGTYTGDTDLYTFKMVRS